MIILPTKLMKSDRFFSDQFARGMPLVLLVNIPMHEPVKNFLFGCKNPNWGMSTEHNSELQRGLKCSKADVLQQR